MLNEIKGIGPKTIEYLNALNINSTNDLLEYYPYKYKIYNPVNILNSNENENIVITGYIESNPKIFYINKKLSKMSFKFCTNNIVINVSIFNRAYLKKSLIIGKQITIIGKYTKKSNSFLASEIKLEPIFTKKIEAIYHLNNKIKKATFNKLISTLLLQNIYLPNYIPEYLRNKYKFDEKINLIKEIHNPSNIDSLKKAKTALIYEEFFVFLLKLHALKEYRKSNSLREKKEFNEKKIDQFIKNLPFKLTSDQQKAVIDIKNDLKKDIVMNRLLLGDVGSGKTIIAFIALYTNYLSGYQGILMAPTEILATQHCNNIKNIFKDYNLNIELLTSSCKIKKRKEIIKDIYNKKIDILIGTHSILNNEIVFNNLGLVITDEQHRFGVNQRRLLKEKSNNTDVLYMSATPIPRTLALTLFGDMDISRIHNKPNNRKEIITKLFKSIQIKEVLNEILNEIKKGHQIYIIAPLIEDDDGETNLNTVSLLKEKMNIAFNNKIPIEIMHGKLKSNEKNDIMQNFKDNKTKILISTTVIEVGVDISNATMMIIFNAEMFGLATLHQLRGRIGRNNLECKCFLISDKDTPRLNVLLKSNDGFYISEKDFEMRGSGDLFGIKQSGDMIFKIGNLKTDFKIFEACQNDIKDFVKNEIIKENDYLIQKEIINTIKLNY